MKKMTVLSFPARMLEMIAITGVYYLSGWVCLRMAIPPGVATPFWIPSGIALAAVLMKGRRVWPAVAIGAFLVNSPSLGFDSPAVFFISLLTVLGIALGSALQAVLGAYFIRLFTGSRSPFNRIADVFKFTGVEMFACVVSPTIGISCLLAGRFIAWDAAPYSWFTWWTGDFVGVMTVTPFLMVWSRHDRKDWPRTKIFEMAGYFLCLSLAAFAVFGENNYQGFFGGHFFPYLLFPFTVWAAFRFGLRSVTFSILFISAAAVWGTLHGCGPFVRPVRNTSLLMLQPFMGILSLTSLSLGAALLERKAARKELERSQRNLVDFIESATVGLHWAAEDGTILWANKEELRMLGYEPEEYIGHSVAKFHADQKLIEDLLARLRKNEELRDCEARLVCKDGTLRHVLISSNVLWENGEFVHSRCFTRDITDRKRAEENLLKAHEELERRVEERTQELLKTYKALETEMDERLKAQKEILEISEREQKRIGQDLHDGLAQQLAGLSFMSKSLQFKLSEKTLPEAADLDDILALIKKTIEETRRISRGFYPIELERLGLFPALKELALDVEKMFQIPCRYQFDDSIKIKQNAVAAHLYRVSQEALSNAIKHGKPKQVTLSMKRENGSVVLKVEDNGIGIEEANLNPKMGLRIMEYRAKMIGGRFKIGPAEQGGTRVTLTFPY